ncbi:MAG: sugar ABC transporter permease, partial [Anaerolineae bacterium]|nr:sugar ABC transporter permease [Anaerolineae bacterium]
MSPPNSAGRRFNPILLLSLVLLLPACVVCGGVGLLPMVDTFQTSMERTRFPSSEGENVGMENFERLQDDERYTENALDYSARLGVMRIAIVAVVPLLVGLLIGAQGWLMRGCNRVLLALALVGASPVPLAILWWLFLGRTWNYSTFDDSPLGEPPDWLALFDTVGARNSVALVEALATLALAVGLGSLFYAAVVRGNRVGGSPWLAGCGVWLVGLFVAAMGVLTAGFSVPLVLTNGGPALRTLTAPLYVFQVGVQRFDLGLAAALQTLHILPILLLGVLVWLVITAFNLRLRFTGYGAAFPVSSLLGCISLPLVVAVGLPALALLAWGAWFVGVNGGVAEVTDEIPWAQNTLNTVLSPWLAIWLVQVPVAYLTGLVLGFWRPLGRIGSSLLFLPFLVIGFLPTSTLFLSWFQNLADADLLETPQNFLGVPWLFGAASLLAFKLYFDGAHDAFQDARERGKSNSWAFLRAVWLPSVPFSLLVGAVLSFLATQELLWSATLSRSLDESTLSASVVRLVALFNIRGGMMGASAMLYWASFAVPFFVVFVLLHWLVIDRLALVAGKIQPVAVPAAAGVPQGYGYGVPQVSYPYVPVPGMRPRRFMARHSRAMA